MADTVTNKKDYDEWEIRNALESLERAEEIKNDPKLMAKAEKLAKKKMDNIQKIKWVK